MRKLLAALAATVALAAVPATASAGPPTPWPPNSVDFGPACVVNNVTKITYAEAECQGATKANVVADNPAACNTGVAAPGSILRNGDGIMTFFYGCSGTTYYIGRSESFKFNEGTAVGLYLNVFRPSKRYYAWYTVTVYKYLTSTGYARYNTGAAELRGHGTY